MGMRDDQCLSKVKVELGCSEDQKVALFRSAQLPKQTKDDANNPELIKEIVKSVKTDFVNKCIAILETCSTIPRSLYTYDIFENMFCFMQKGDVCASGEKEVYKFTISDGVDISGIVKDIIDGYVQRNKKFSLTAIPELIDLGVDSSKKENMIRCMFGAGEFPFLVVKYAWHEGRGEWQYVYHITR